jgi:hypothetical protein
MPFLHTGFAPRKRGLFLFLPMYFGQRGAAFRWGCSLFLRR